MPASVRRFQRGHNTLAVILQIKAAPVLLYARFGRPLFYNLASVNQRTVISTLLSYFS
jgi:hypothetical protein